MIPSHCTALSSTSENYEAIQFTWDETMEATRDTEMRARIGGVSAHMQKFVGQTHLVGGSGQCSDSH